ncbi:MOSC domain-containing protein [Algicella marina]|uniref:MOSC domain-containing protein n=1 Tax=Algicella marina TaxID=2683284 RepID=A0A6P1T3B5_9RHOB|nr:MOSC domain-containing protein [Algicella marina]QHQ37218.1 MOSC domain-containing protein [Algicella marina]
MPILSPTDHYGEITWLGRVADREVTLRADPVEAMDLRYEGIAGEYHGGLVRMSCSRVTSQYPRHTEIRNVRQITILSEEELDATAAAMGVPAIDPTWVGANIILRGIPDFTLIPPSSRLIAGNGTSMTVDMENAPCQFPAKEIEQEHPGLGKGYKAAATGRRGVTAWVERQGSLKIGDRLRLHIPPQRLWAHG